MKILTTILIATLLAGCASFMAPKFDNVQYDKFIAISTNTQLLQEECGELIAYEIRQRLLSMRERAISLDKYASNIPNNKEISGFAKIILEDIEEMLSRYEVTGINQTYCELKTKQLQIKLDRALESIGKLK